IPRTSFWSRWWSWRPCPWPSLLVSSWPWWPPSCRRLLGDLPLLEDPDGVAEGVADAHVDAVEVVGGLLGEVGDAARLEGLVQTPDVVRLEHEPAQGALRDQLPELRSSGFVMHRGPGSSREISVTSPGTRTVS